MGFMSEEFSGEKPGAVATWPSAARAQQQTNRTIGYLGSVSYANSRYKVAFLQGLKAAMSRVKMLH
jgi:hypothetical protein